MCVYILKLDMAGIYSGIHVYFLNVTVHARQKFTECCASFSSTTRPEPQRIGHQILSPLQLCRLTTSAAGFLQYLQDRQQRDQVGVGKAESKRLPSFWERGSKKTRSLILKVPSRTAACSLFVPSGLVSVSGWHALLVTTGCLSVKARFNIPTKLSSLQISLPDCLWKVYVGQL